MQNYLHNSVNTSNLNNLPIVVGISGASGAIYGVTLLKALKDLNIPTILTLSSSAIITIKSELNLTIKEVISLATCYYPNNDIGAKIASGSFLTRGMIVAPCSVKSLSAIAHSYSSTLLVRAADVCLKERRPLVLLFRETPFHLGHIKLMEQATLNGAVVMPPLPAFYTNPKSIEDLVNTSIAKLLDIFKIQHNLAPRWN